MCSAAVHSEETPEARAARKTSWLSQQQLLGFFFHKYCPEIVVTLSILIQVLLLGIITYIFHNL